MLLDDWHTFQYGPASPPEASTAVPVDSEGGEALFAVELFVITNTSGWRRTTEDQGMAERLLAHERSLDPGARLFRYKREEEILPIEDDE
jgi:hypothetical protein